MIAVRHVASGAVHIVESLDGYGAPDWQMVGELPEGVPPELTRVEGDAVVEDLGPLERALHAMIDAEAGAQRLKYITEVPGQQAVYKSKEAEARAFISDADPDEPAYPYLYADAAATGRAPSDVAAEIVAISAAWTVVSAAIEAKRICAKRAVSAATSADAMRAAAAVNW